MGKKVTLLHKHTMNIVLVYKASSDKLWSGILAQVSWTHLQLQISEQKSVLLDFFSGRFDKTKYGWSILEKESFSVMATLELVNWMEATP